MKELLKKSLALFSSVLTAGLLVVSPLSANASELRNGDTNNDGIIDIYDAINICKHIMKPTISDENLEQADYNKNGNVDLHDAIFVTRLIVCESKLNNVVSLINLKRSVNGAEPLVIDHSLVDASMKRASELPHKFSGDYRPDNSSFQTIFTEYGIEYSECANCIAAVPETPKALYDAMMAREDIEERLCNPAYTRIGVGYYSYNDEYEHYWAILLV